MINIVDKTPFGRMARVWFCNEEYKGNETLVRYVRPSSKLLVHGKYISDEYITVISDLRLSDEELLQQTRKKVRYEIKRAQKEKIETNFYLSDDLRNNGDILQRFNDAYLSFCKQINDKSVKKAYSKKKIRSYINCNCILISVGKLNQAEVYHVYVHDKDNCCLIYSVSDFRNGNVDNYLAGRINKYLHYQDMLYFKKRGVMQYDWGNLSSDSDFNGIDNFKLSFGGKMEKGNNVLTARNIVGNLLVSLYGVIKKVRKEL